MLTTIQSFQGRKFHEFHKNLPYESLQLHEVVIVLTIVVQSVIGSLLTIAD